MDRKRGKGRAVGSRGRLFKAVLCDRPWADVEQVGSARRGQRWRQRTTITTLGARVFPAMRPGRPVSREVPAGGAQRSELAAGKPDKQARQGKQEGGQVR